MRNGNLNFCIDSYSNTIICSYPTYEEWKPLLSASNILSPFGSYPTYEEWKPCKYLYICLIIISVLILPMRNGNFIFAIHSPSFLQFGSYPTYEEWKPSNLSKELHFQADSSYPTYEEWKLPGQDYEFVANIQFLSYL